MKITYNFTKKDYFALERYYAIHSPGLYVWVAIFVSLLLTSFSISIQFTSGAVNVKMCIYASIMFVVFVFLIIPLSFYQTYWKMKRKRPEIFGQQQLELLNEGLKATNAISSYTRIWESVYGFKESKTHYLLFIQKALAFVIPKDAFSSVQEMEQFQAMIKYNLKK